MRALALLLAAVAVATTPAEARPNADIVIVWAPGARLDPIGAAVREAGAAMIDRSPAAAAAPDTASVLKRGISAYDALQIADAVRFLDDARATADRTGGAGLSQTELSDLFLYRGLVKSQQGDATAAWDELTTSVIVAPTRVLDPARFPPRVAAELERARIAVAGRGTASVAVDAPTGCATTIDGIDAGRTAATRIIGPHFLHVTCVDRAPWGVRVEITGDTVIAARNTPVAPPSDDEMLIQARTAGAQAFVAISVKDRVATVRLIGSDGRERDRRTVTVTTTLAPVGVAVGELLTPVRTGENRWYRSKWAWAAGAAVIAAAIFIPLTAVTTGNRSATSGTVRPGGVPDSW